MVAGTGWEEGVFEGGWEYHGRPCHHISPDLQCLRVTIALPPPPSPPPSTSTVGTQLGQLPFVNGILRHVSNDVAEETACSQLTVLAAAAVHNRRGRAAKRPPKTPNVSVVTAGSGQDSRQTRIFMGLKPDTQRFLRWRWPGHGWSGAGKCHVSERGAIVGIGIVARRVGTVVQVSLGSAIVSIRLRFSYAGEAILAARLLDSVQYECHILFQCLDLPVYLLRDINTGPFLDADDFLQMK